MHAGSGPLKKALLFIASESVFFLLRYFVCRVTSPLGFLFNLQGKRGNTLSGQIRYDLADYLNHSPVCIWGCVFIDV